MALSLTPSVFSMGIPFQVNASNGLNASPPAGNDYRYPIVLSRSSASLQTLLSMWIQLQIAENEVFQTENDLNQRIRFF